MLAMTRKTELSLAEQLAILAEYGKKHGVSATAYSIAHATEENTTNIQRILNGDNANPGLRTLRAMTGYFEVGLGYLDYRTEADCRAYLAQLEAEKALAEVSEEQVLEEITRRSRGLGPAGLLALKNIVNYLEQVNKKGRSGK
jgi:hypothetical protein